MSACRWRSSSRRRATTVIGVDINAGRIEARLRAASRYIEDVSDERLRAVARPPRRSRRRAARPRASPTRSSICVPTPLTPNREPDLGPLLGAGDALGRRSCSAASWSCSSRRPTPARRASACCPRSRSPGLRPATDFHLAFSPERVDPGRTDYTLRTTPKIVGGLTAGCTERALERSTARSATASCRVSHPRGGGDGEAAREHLPLGEHRARQRARDARRPHGHRHLGGRRRRADEAVRLHALRPGARAWAGTACRSTRST